MKKKVNTKGLVIIAIILLVLASIICLGFANKMSSNRASIMGGALSVAATTLLGMIAVWQNKRYKELADEKSTQAENLMFTPECRLFDIYTNSQFSAYKQTASVLASHSPDYYLHFFTLNLPMLDISTDEISYYEKGNEDHKQVFSREKITFSIFSFSILESHTAFEIKMDFAETLKKSLDVSMSNLRDAFKRLTVLPGIGRR